MLVFPIRYLESKVSTLYECVYDCPRIIWADEVSYCAHSVAKFWWEDHGWYGGSALSSGYEDTLLTTRSLNGARYLGEGYVPFRNA